MARKSAADIEPNVIDDATLRGFVGYNMKRAYMSLQNDLLAVLDEFDLRLSSFSALVLIADNPDMTQSQLAAALNIEPSGVVLLVDDLESRELITRNKVPGDRRTYALRVTLAGARLRDKAIAEIHAHEDRFLGKMTADQRTTLIDLLNRIESDLASEASRKSR